MDVRCNRCGTDYEFDDTLISDRGTTVQCTNCGFQFKIFPEKRGALPPERWQVRTASGKELVFTSLRELQRAITERRVGPRDLLSRGPQAARALGSIPELEPFFTAQAAAPRGMQSAPGTLHGVAPEAGGTPRAAEEPAHRTQLGIGHKTLVSPGNPEAPAPAAGRRGSRAGQTMAFEQQALPPMVLGGGAAASADTEREPEPRHLDPGPAPGYGDVPPVPAGFVRESRSSDVIGPGGTLVSGSFGVATNEARGAGARPPGVADAEPRLPRVAPTSTVRIEPNQPDQLGSTIRMDPAPAPVTQRTAPPESFDSTLSAGAPKQFAPAPAAYAFEPPRAENRSSPRSSPFENAPTVASSPRGAPAPTPPPISTRERLPSYDEFPEVDALAPARNARSRWIAGVVFLAVAGLLGATVGRQYLARFSSAKKPDAALRDERSARFLAEGMRLVDRADYEGAHEQLAKAEALADRDAAVLAARARLETSRADLYWLKLRLLDPTATALVQATQRELDRYVAKARGAVDAAFASAPEDPIVVRARIDALRVGGSEAKARQWIGPVAANASDPQNAYVLAALDLAEAAPVFSTVIDRLRAASVSSQESARARAALVYALVRAGRVVEVDTELSKITGAEHPHPLVEELKGFVARFSAGVDAGADGAAPSESVSGTASAQAPDAAPAASGAAPSDVPPAGPSAPLGDFRARLAQAAQAVSRGELARAEALYQSVASEQPSNTEALAGLAEVAQRRGDSATSARLYDRVLANNPSYLPALMASANQKWQAGDRKGAVTLYRRVVEQVGPSTDYGQRAAARIAEAERAGAEETPPGQAAPAAPEAQPPSTPEIDTSDLPGVTPP